ncbi:carbohydrate ABC transporter permease [Agromyces archimandritae]|uniref:Carbohydrate ABC transporter permease n=1 Tax=Agromyces archimandritae TaxID=2781962 RepID=A0A975FMW2_9MICO|nr:carbohydrate ABC transporter permease [Agromyces archimandritae]QTX03931.1 carbohydrate ABC transporter permease [Agromyces archimandritae]
MTTQVTAGSRIAVAPAGRATRDGRPKKIWLQVLFNAIAAVVIACSVFPVYWMVNASFTPTNKIITREPSFFPTEFTWKNYVTAWTREAAPGQTDFPHALGTSLLIALSVVVICALFAFMASIAIARFAFRGRYTFIVSVLIVQMVPGEAMMYTVYNMLDDVQLVNHLFGLFLVHLAAVVPFTIWTLRGFVAGVPADLEEAAQIDGCSKSQAFWKVTFPLLAPGLVSTGIFAFIQSWNEFTMALLLMKGYNLTLPPWLNSFQSATEATNWGAVMAGATLIALPVVIFFLFVQGRMVGGLVSGAVKG